MSKSIILINKTSINISKFKPKQKTRNNTISDNTISILSPPTQKHPDPELINNSTNKIITDFRFLIGRKLNKDIIAINGEIIAKSGNIISKETVHKASLYGKLAEITRYSKKRLTY